MAQWCSIYCLDESRKTRQTRDEQCRTVSELVVLTIGFQWNSQATDRRPRQLFAWRPCDIWMHAVAGNWFDHIAVYNANICNDMPRYEFWMTRSRVLMRASKYFAADNVPWVLVASKIATCGMRRWAGIGCCTDSESFTDDRVKTPVASSSVLLAAFEVIIMLPIIALVSSIFVHLSFLFESIHLSRSWNRMVIAGPSDYGVWIIGRLKLQLTGWMDPTNRRFQFWFLVT